jgi:succinoglycan biosynthesis protein ExoW
MTLTTLISGYDDGDVAVIIPYYQRDSGILARALASVFRQQDCPPVWVIIVDDASPAPPEPELEGLGTDARARVTIVKQRNLGPGQARNTGLATVPNSAAYVAFLDSDDVWREGHLSRAVAALSEGLDFYFADGNAEGAAVGRFGTLPFDVSVHECIDHSRKIYRFRGDFLDMLLRWTPVITSTVVMRRDKLGLVRFPPWRGICEDLLYWLQVAITGPNVGFSAAAGVTGGREGLHISHKGEWNTDKALTMASDYIRYYRRVLESIPLSDTQRANIHERARSKRIEFLLVAGSMLKAGRIPSPLRVGLFLLRNPMVVWEFASDFRLRPRPS